MLNTFRRKQQRKLETMRLRVITAGRVLLCYFLFRVIFFVHFHAGKSELAVIASIV